MEMSDDQAERLFGTLGRIEQKLDSHLEDDEVVHRRHEGTLSDHATAIHKNATTLARLRGIGVGVGGVVTLALGALGLDRFGGS